MYSLILGRISDMSIVLDTEQREQAGSDSYNRFEYQVHWIVCHVIDQMSFGNDCIVFCEYHDDMAEFSSKTDQFQFYQIKTKDSPSDWTITELAKKEKRKAGGYKKSFLGFIFYNFLKFASECASCHFVSNCDFDRDMRQWQAYIEDGKIVSQEDPELYRQLKNRIENEYSDDMPKNFDAVFDSFIQNTFLRKSDLQLDTYEDQTKGKFFDQLEDKNIPAGAAHLILKQLISDVRHKSKEKVCPPISMKRLIEKKGIDIGTVTGKLNHQIGGKGNYAEFEQFLYSQHVSQNNICRLVASKAAHDSRWLNIEDLKYQEIVLSLRKLINEYRASHVGKLDTNELKVTCMEELQRRNLLSYSMDMSLIEVLYYEQEYSKIRTQSYERTVLQITD